MCMEEHTCEAKLPCINENVVQKIGISGGNGAAPAALSARLRPDIPICRLDYAVHILQHNLLYN